MYVYAVYELVCIGKCCWITIMARTVAISVVGIYIVTESLRYN